ncbi:hypothetical protein [Haladaptatus halobius]|uniref:hypothetical protein n=1 Tax=Haladaptatus halobius TaxID=2884875 RepID=UPI001D0AE118|nr:hypothetical protein [Haladaptatus halobius]
MSMLFGITRSSSALAPSSRTRVFTVSDGVITSSGARGHPETLRCGHRDRGRWLVPVHDEKCARGFASRLRRQHVFRNHRGADNVQFRAAERARNRECESSRRSLTGRFGRHRAVRHARLLERLVVAVPPPGAEDKRVVTATGEEFRGTPKSACCSRLFVLGRHLCDERDAHTHRHETRK